jgi:cytochrome subunit of sulfide dehydrogenase
MIFTSRLIRLPQALLVAGVLSATTTAVYAQNAQNASYLAASCANCHGTDGNAQGPGSWPLAGKPKAYIAEQMAAFKAGTRQATIMHQISKGYTDEQIGLMAEYFSKQKPRQ